MTFLYVSDPDNQVKVFQVDEKGNLVKFVQKVNPVVDPLPPGCEKLKPGPYLATEWVDKHPKYNLLFALTSFWTNHHAILTTFRIDKKTGELTKLTSCDTGGFQAAQGIFSPDGSTYTVCHHNDGRITFFDITRDEGITEYVRVIRAPELVPGTFVEPKDTKMGVGVPCVHGITYSPNGKYLVLAEAMQTGAITYECDIHGRPKKESEDEVVADHSHVLVNSEMRPPGWLGRTIAYALTRNCPRIRRAAVHPNGKYLYLLSEMFNFVQVFSIDETGKIGSECLQEIKIAGVELEKECWIGIGITCASEFQAYDDHLLVSVRGISAGGGAGKAEYCVRVLNYVDDGKSLKLAEQIETRAAVRHFARQGNILWAGMNSNSQPYVQKYAKKSSDDTDSQSYELIGEVDVGVDVLCVVPVENSALC